MLILFVPFLSVADDHPSFVDIWIRRAWIAIHGQHDNAMGKKLLDTAVINGGQNKDVLFLLVRHESFITLYITVLVILLHCLSYGLLNLLFWLGWSV